MVSSAWSGAYVEHRRRKLEQTISLSKKKIAQRYQESSNRAFKGLDSKLYDLDKGRISRTSFESSNAKATKATINAYAKYHNDKAKAKRDYQIAKGKSAKKANAKYERAKQRNLRNAQEEWDDYVESIARDYPTVAANLAKMGSISYEDLGRANERIRENTNDYIMELELKQQNKK